MSDSFSKIVAILISVILMFIIPISITRERQNEYKQTYVLSETMYLVDNIRNTGVLSKEMYNIYVNKITGMINNSRIEIVSSDMEYKDFVFLNDIIDGFKNNEKYEFARFDYIKIIVYENDKPIAYYGGSVK
ncbi:MAG: hypothetical protein E7270_05665 [Lachnospiraceae bacterium]|nr:hypothetical protein [Lachnospiraceae bacterium]MBQ4068201.1 hypothetical protein [Lachnospiraceae bacterium]